jgi:hypothetical protein
LKSVGFIIGARGAEMAAQSQTEQFIYLYLSGTPPLSPVRHPGQAKREPGSLRTQA